MNTSTNKGFTLLEILLVVAAIGILAGIVILAINPGKQLGDTRNAQRKADVNTILNAIYQYSIDNNGLFPNGVEFATATPRILGTDVTGCDSSAICAATTSANVACANLTELVPTYIVDIPKDPTSGTVNQTDYFVRKLPTGRIMVGACDPEQGEVISVTR